MVLTGLEVDTRISRSTFVVLVYPWFLRSLAFSVLLSNGGEYNAEIKYEILFLE